MINFNDRRKKKQETRAMIKAMAKQGTLRATTTSPGQRAFGKAERSAVQEEVRSNIADWGSRGDRYSRAAKKVEKATDVKGYDAPAYRQAAGKSAAKGKQPRKLLPKVK